MLGLPRSLGSDKNAGMKTAGRNDPCPCGSGKKYKKCCLPRETAPVKRTPEDAPEEPFIAEIRPDLNEAIDLLLQRLERGEGKGLEGEFQTLLQQNPHYYLTNYAMGVYVGMVRQDPVGATPFFEKAVRVFPPFAEGHFNLGQSYRKAVRIAEAVGAYRKAIRYSSGGDGIAALAEKELRGLERIIRDTSAFETLDAFLDHQKLFDRAFENLRSQSYEEAIGLFSRVLEQNPKHVQSYGNMALAHAGLGHKAAAIECFDKALALDPSYEPALLNKQAIQTMTEGEPYIPSVFAETEYYRERFEAKKSPGESWWQKLGLRRADTQQRL